MYRAVVIGTSYGGLEALNTILPNLKKDFPIPVIIVLHVGEHSNDYFISQLQLASSAKGYKEMINGQTDIVADFSSKVQGIARNTLDIINESRDEVSTWFEKNVKEAEKGLKEVTKEVTKVVPVTTKAA